MLIKRLFAFCCLCILFIATYAQYVTIPDTAFVSWLDNNGFASCINGSQLDTTCQAVLSADTLRPKKAPIRNLWGVQFFKNLTWLNCAGDSLASLPALPPSLTFFGCYGNNITSLPPLPETLTYLECYDNKLTSLPAHLPDSLSRLLCSSNSLTMLPQLPGSITYIQCNNNQIDSLPHLPESLLYLDMEYNNIRTLPVLPVFLNFLFCYQNPIDSFPSLPNQLIGFNWGGFHIQTLPTLPASLKFLNCTDSFLDSLPQLPDSLEGLTCYDNLLSALPSLPSSLTYLDCSRNQLTYLPTLPDSLNILNCNSNMQLSCLPQLKRIVVFSFDSTAITCLPDYGNITNSSPVVDSFPLCTSGNANGCTVYTDIKYITDVTNLAIYPNPTNSQLEIELQNVFTGYLQVSVIDISGQVLKSENINATGKIEMDVSVLSAGLYFLMVQGDRVSLVRKFVKE